MLHISRAGCYSSWLKDWRARHANQQTYAAAKAFWQAAHIQWMKESKGSNFGYGLNAQVYDADTDNVNGDDQGALAVSEVRISEIWRSSPDRFSMTHDQQVKLQRTNDYLATRVTPTLPTMK